MSDYKRDNFNICIEFVLKHEGGYVNNPNDPGGETKFGISKRAYPRCDISSLTTSKAKRIYKEDYWNAIKGDFLPLKVAFLMFDMGVNAGISRSIIIAQRIVNAKEDGILGSKTLLLLNNLDTRQFIIKFTIERELYYAQCKAFNFYKRGWLTRATECLADSLDLEKEKDYEHKEKYKTTWFRRFRNCFNYSNSGSSWS